MSSLTQNLYFRLSFFDFIKVRGITKASCK